MKIIQVISSLHKSGGGPTVTVTGLSKNLVNLGTDVSLITQCPSKTENNADFLIPSSDEVRTVLVRSSADFLSSIFAKQFRSEIKDQINGGAELVHINGLWQPISHAATVVAKRKAVPIIISPRGMLEPWALKHRFWKKKLAWWSYQRSDMLAANVIHATAEQEAENFRLLGLRQPIAVIPNGVDFESLRLNSSLLSIKEVANKERRTVLFLSRIHPKKGLLELVQAWARLRPLGWRVVIAGPDENGHRAQVEASIASQGLMGDFEFVGSVDGQDKAALYHSADLFVLPTFSENFGVVIAEALACGLPVITTTGAPWQGLATRRCGWWIDIGVDPLTDALCQAMALSDCERRVMGEQGREYVRQYDWDYIARQTIDVYRWVLGKGPQPRCIRTD